MFFTEAIDSEIVFGGHYFVDTIMFYIPEQRTTYAYHEMFLEDWFNFVLLKLLNVLHIFPFKAQNSLLDKWKRL